VPAAVGVSANVCLSRLDTSKPSFRLRPTLVIYRCSAVPSEGRLKPSVAFRGVSPDGSLVELTDLPDSAITSTGAAGDIGFSTVELRTQVIPERATDAE
jgi:hypothetical protein